MHLYLHIPFCRQACHYCDFHFSTNTNAKSEMVKAIAKEIVLRREYLPAQKLETIYFGGGTPSMLDKQELDHLLQTIHDNFEIAENAEITLEANPDDLDSDKLYQLAESGINRLSIGIQSFHQPHLTFLNRIHSATEAENCVRIAQEAGITNISIDLIYAIPSEDHTVLELDIAKALQLNVSHISAYCLTIEPQTAFGSWLKKKKIQPIDEEFAARQFEILTSSLAKNGFEQYEISNFAKNDRYSRHNSSYWQQRPYLGVGPSAHSYNGNSREYNIANNSKYIAALDLNQIPATYEELTTADRTNEYLLTGLRTKWGVNTDELERLSNGKFWIQNERILNDMFQNGLIHTKEKVIVLTQAGKLFADRIASDLFIDED
ncbi:radical SAM family heme chaperone HemW [Dyadobacter sp. CY312]|uniref:radical SAM family heme chaperone HemW n=1 Tax=Dyadobacter sp. CY312 TaxID=2907303 RepID=UPI001F457046|nr:radical SAM family heme chaperone HemW [Dyadobacter sp. CY312]MCE7041604.1 radical SAM family heme chaperone HemW [Dyadobacter sp. CY312]